MFKKLIILLIFNLSFNVNARAPGTYFQLKSELQKVSSRNLISFVNDLIRESIPSRMVGAPGHNKAQAFIIKTISSFSKKNSGQIITTEIPADIGMIKDFYQKDFDEKVEGKIPSTSAEYQKWLKFTRSMAEFAEARKSNHVKNIVWEKSGINTKKVLVVTAHYDTISHDKKTYLVNENEATPGANFNASGVAVALGLIKILSEIDLNYSVKVVFLDWQGIGFHGSQLYAKELKGSGHEVMGVINLEMLGQDSSYFDKTKKIGNMSLYIRDQSDETRWAKKLTELGSQMTTKVNFEIKPNGFPNSDNFRFWEQGFLSATFSQNWEDDFNPKFYQTPQDTPETLNHETLYASFQYVGGAVIGTLLDLTK